MHTKWEKIPLITAGLISEETCIRLLWLCFRFKIKFTHLLLQGTVKCLFYVALTSHSYRFVQSGDIPVVYVKIWQTLKNSFKKIPKTTQTKRSVVTKDIRIDDISNLSIRINRKFLPLPPTGCYTKGLTKCKVSESWRLLDMRDKGIKEQGQQMRSFLWQWCDWTSMKLWHLNGICKGKPNLTSCAWQFTTIMPKGTPQWLYQNREWYEVQFIYST